MPFGNVSGFTITSALRQSKNFASATMARRSEAVRNSTGARVPHCRPDRIYRGAQRDAKRLYVLSLADGRKVRTSRSIELSREELESLDISVARQGRTRQGRVAKLRKRNVSSVLCSPDPGISADNDVPHQPAANKVASVASQHTRRASVSRSSNTRLALPHSSTISSNARRLSGSV
jgi:hypothetical protein